MPESVELNGMTINLVEDKHTYESMTKNPNEMYLVEKDYDMVVDIEADAYDDAEVNVVSGTTAAIHQKMLADPYCMPQILVRISLHYNEAFFQMATVVTPMYMIIGEPGTDEDSILFHVAMNGGDHTYWYYVHLHTDGGKSIIPVWI